MTLVKIAYEQGQLAALGLFGLTKAANLFQHVPPEAMALRAKGLTAAGHAHVPNATSFDLGLVRPHAPAPTAPIATGPRAVPSIAKGTPTHEGLTTLGPQKNPTIALNPETMGEVSKWHQLHEAFQGKPAAPVPGGSQPRARLADLTKGLEDEKWTELAGSFPQAPAAGGAARPKMVRLSDLLEKSGSAAAAFKRMVRGGGREIVEAPAVNPFRPLAKGAVPHVERGATPFTQGFAAARPVPGFGEAGRVAPTQAAFSQLGGKIAPEAAATGALRGIPAAAPVPAAAPAASPRDIAARLRARTPSTTGRMPAAATPPPIPAAARV